MNDSSNMSWLGRQLFGFLGYQDVEAVPTQEQPTELPSVGNIADSNRSEDENEQGISQGSESDSEISEDESQSGRGDLGPTVFQISAHCREQHESDDFGLNRVLRDQSPITIYRRPINNEVEHSPFQLWEESQYIICNVTNEILDLLPKEQRNWILDFRNKIANDERRDGGKLPANVWVDDTAHDAIREALNEFEEPYRPQTLLYWSDGSYFKYNPKSSAGGIVFRRKDGLYCQIHISHDMRVISSQYDSELLTLIRTIRIGLREANRRFLKGIFVREIVVYLDPMGLLWRLRDLHYSEAMTAHYKELFCIVRLCRDASVDVRMFWVPKRGMIVPHVLADDAAKAQNEEATRQARDRLSREVFDNLEFVPPIRDFVDFVDRTAGRRGDDEEDRADRDWDEAWRQLRKREILDRIVE